MIAGITNYNTDNSILIEIWPSSFGPKGKYEPTMEGGGSIIVPVLIGNNSNYIWSGSFDSAGWALDQYMVRAEVIGKGYAETEQFELINAAEKPISTPIPVTTPESSPVQITNTSAGQEPSLEKSENVEKTEPTPVPTQKSPLLLTGIISSLCICIGIFTVLRTHQ